MKYRKDFVTNSSSSSYTCEICGSEESGWDYCLSDVEMVECENGHTFCERHMHVSAKDLIEACVQVNKDNEDDEWDDPIDVESLRDESDEIVLEAYLRSFETRENVSAKFCPICNMETANDRDIISYFLKKNNLTRKELPDVWQREFGTYAKLKEYISR